MNRVLFAACAVSGNPPGKPPQSMMVILSAADGKILVNLPLAGGSDGILTMSQDVGRHPRLPQAEGGADLHPHTGLLHHRDGRQVEAPISVCDVCTHLRIKQLKSTLR